MEVHELANKVRNNLNNESLYIEDLIKWCDENVEKIDLSNSDQMFLCENATKYLMENKFQKSWSKDNAKFITTYLAKKQINELGLNEEAEIIIYEKEEYIKKYGESSSAICVPLLDDTYSIAYSPSVIKDLISENKGDFLRGLQTVFHEIQHVNQNISLFNEKNKDGSDRPKSVVRYLSALESIARKADEKFYKENYGKLLKENDAQKNGLIKAVKAIQKYSPELSKQYNMTKIVNLIEKYDKNYFEALASNSNDIKIDFKRDVDTKAGQYIETHPELIEKYPILKVGFNLDGTKKSIIELIEDRNQMLKNEGKQEKIDNLYEIIANHRNVLTNGLTGTTAEMTELKSYIEKTGTEDEFIYSLLRYRVENRTNATPENKKIYMDQVYANAAKTRKERDEKEIEHEKTESIRDEVGDEFKSKTTQQEQEEQEVETMWQNRFQSWDRDSVNLPNSAKRKEEAVHIMKNIEKEKELDEQRKLQEQEEMEGRK